MKRRESKSYPLLSKCRLKQSSLFRGLRYSENLVHAIAQPSAIPTRRNNKTSTIDWYSEVSTKLWEGNLGKGEYCDADPEMAISDFRARVPSAGRVDTCVKFRMYHHDHSAGRDAAAMTGVPNCGQVFMYWAVSSVCIWRHYIKVNDLSNGSKRTRKKLPYLRAYPGACSNPEPKKEVSLYITPNPRCPYAF